MTVSENEQSLHIGYVDIDEKLGGRILLSGTNGGSLEMVPYLAGPS